MKDIIALVLDEMVGAVVNRSGNVDDVYYSIICDNLAVIYYRNHWFCNVDISDGCLIFIGQSIVSINLSDPHAIQKAVGWLLSTIALHG